MGLRCACRLLRIALRLLSSDGHMRTSRSAPPTETVGWGTPSPSGRHTWRLDWPSTVWVPLGSPVVMVVAAARVPVVILPAVMEVTTLSVNGRSVQPQPPASLLISSEMAATVPSALV